MGALIGCKYRRFGTGPDAFSCDGLVVHILRLAGFDVADPYTEPEKAEDQFEEIDPAAPWPLLAIVGMRSDSRDFVKHMAVYLGFGLCIQSVPGCGVEIFPRCRMPQPLLRLYRFKESC